MAGESSIDRDSEVQPSREGRLAIAVSAAERVATALDEPRSSGPAPDRRSLRQGGAEALGGAPAAWFVQSRSPALADIIGARRVRTAVMISSGSMPWR